MANDANFLPEDVSKKETGHLNDFKLILCNTLQAPLVISAQDMLKRFIDASSTSNLKSLHGIIFACKYVKCIFSEPQCFECSSDFWKVLTETIEFLHHRNSCDVLFNQVPAATNLDLVNPRIHSNLFYFLRLPLELIWRAIGDYNFRYLFSNSSVFYQSKKSKVLIQLSGTSVCEKVFASSRTRQGSAKSTESNELKYSNASICPHPLLLCKDSKLQNRLAALPNIWKPEFVISNKTVENLAASIFEIKPAKSGSVFLGKHLRKFPPVLKKLLISLKSKKLTKNSQFQVVTFLNEFINYVPLEVFGSQTNKAATKTWLSNYLKMGRFDKIDLRQLMRQLSTGSMKWLTNFDLRQKGNACKAAAFAEQFFTWLLFGVFISKMNSTYRIEADGSNPGELNFVNKTEVMQNQYKALEVFTNEPLELYQKVKCSDVEKLVKNDKILGVSKLKFQKKPNGAFRPIVKHGEVNNIQLSESSVNRKLESARDFLSFLFQSSDSVLSGGCSVGSGAIDKTLARMLREFFENISGPKIYFAKADIEKCYDNIDQDKMCEIVKDLFNRLKSQHFVYQKVSAVCEKNKTENELLFSVRKLKHSKEGSKYVRFSKIVRKLSHGFVSLEDSLESLAQQFKKISNSVKICELKRFETEEVKIDSILKSISMLVKRNILKATCGKDNFLWQRKGLSQGANISSFLNFLYLNEVDKRYLIPVLKNHGLLLRNVDDYLLITEKQEMVQKFKNLFLEGFSELNLKANPNKLQVYESGGETQSFIWSGVSINVNLGDISPNYKPLLDRKPSLIIGQVTSKMILMRLTAVLKTNFRWSFYADGFTSEKTWSKNLRGVVHCLIVRLKYMLHFVPLKRRKLTFRPLKLFFLQLPQYLFRRCRIRKDQSLALFTKRTIYSSVLDNIGSLDDLVDTNDLIAKIFSRLEV